MATDAPSVDAFMHFLRRSPAYETEKPYSLRFPPAGGLAQSNVQRDKRLLHVESMRNRDDLTLERCGFEALRVPSVLSYEEFEDNEKITGDLLPSLCETLKQHLNAKHVVPIDFSVRRRHAAFPISTGKDYEHDQPTAMAHIDFTTEEGERMLRTMYGDRANEILTGGWKVINVWRPLRGPLNDWPLGICDGRTVDLAVDTMPGDIVYAEWATENLQVHYSTAHQWYYLPDQTVDELLIFKSADSRPDKVAAVPHGSFYNPRAGRDEPPRESIDSRFFVLFAHLEKYPPVKGDIFSHPWHQQGEDRG